MIEQGLFKRHFVGRDGFQWWVGQIPPEESWKSNISGGISEDNSEQKGFGERYRVRILGYHTANADDIPDEELPWAYVMYPVTAGGGGRGSSQSANLTQGTFVFGFFMDGEDAQLPVIMGVLGNNDYNAVMKNVTPTRFIPFDGYPMNDEVMGQQRSTLQVRNSGGGTEEKQENAQGATTNSQYTSSAQGNTSTRTKNDELSSKERSEPLSQTSECEKTPLGDIQKVLQNLMNDLQDFNQMLYDARASIAQGAADAKKWIAKRIEWVSNKISAALKWMFGEIEKFILKRINNLSKLSFNFVFPDLRESLSNAMQGANDAVVCIIRNLINELPSMVGNFVNLAAGLIQNPPNVGAAATAIASKLVNVPKCFVEFFTATVLGNIQGLLEGAINDALGQIDAITGNVTSLVGDVIGFLDDLISYLTCGGLATVECPGVNEWNILTGAGSKGGITNINSMLSQAKGIGNKAVGVAQGAADSIQGVADSVTNRTLNTVTSLTDIDFIDVFAQSGCFLGPRPCGTPNVEYIGDGRGAAINLVVSAAGEILAGDVVNSGIGFKENKSFLKVFDDCGIGKGAVIKPVFGDVVAVPEEDFDGVPDSNVELDDNGFPLGTTGVITLPDGSKISAGIGSEKPIVTEELYYNTETGKYTTDPNQSTIVAVNPLTGEPLIIPEAKTGKPGDDTPDNAGKKLITKSGLPGELLEVCRIVEFKLQRGSQPNTAPIQLTFTLVGDPPDYNGTTTFSFNIDQSGTSVNQCLYPNRDYLVTATTFRTPDTDNFRNLVADGLFDQDDPNNIKLRITDGVQDEGATFGDYPSQTSSTALQKGNGLWADFKDSEGDREVGSPGPRDFQIYPNKGIFKEVNSNSDDKVLFRYDADPLPALDIPPELPPKGIVDVIVVNSGYDYLPGPDGSQGGDGNLWAKKDSTIITGDPGDGTTDYYPPVPPGNTVGIPLNGTVTTPINSKPSDVVDPDGNMIEVLPGVPTLVPNGGTITTPPLDDSLDLRGNYPSTDSYPVILYLCELIVDESGMDYSPEDEIIIEPSMGATAVPKFDNLGRLLSIKVTSGGEGFTTRPKVYVKTETGFGSFIIPKFCIDRIGTDDLERDPSLQDKVVNVINCVGKF